MQPEIKGKKCQYCHLVVMSEITNIALFNNKKWSASIITLIKAAVKKITNYLERIKIAFTFPLTCYIISTTEYFDSPLS